MCMARKDPPAQQEVIQPVRNAMSSGDEQAPTIELASEDALEIAKKKKSKSRVNEAGNYTKPALRKRIFNRIKAGSKGGRPGQWSARKAQMMAKAYKAAGGGYKS